MSRPKQFGTFDNKSDRRDLLQLLERLTQEERTRFVLSVARNAGIGRGHDAVGQPSAGEAYGLIAALAGQFRGVDIEAVAIRLEQIVRRKERIDG